MPADPYPDDLPSSYSQFAIDIQGYSRITEEYRQTQVLRDLSRILDKAARSAHVDRESWDIQHKGDGELALIPATVRKANLVADYVRELVTELTRYNRPLNDYGRLRVRVALHYGEARSDQGNFPGNAPIVVCRLLDSAPLKDALRGEPQAYLALILSDRMFEDTVMIGERGLDRARYTRVEIKQEKWEGVGWVTVPDFGAPALARTEDPSPTGAMRNSQVLYGNSRGVVEARGATTLGDNSTAVETFFSDHGADPEKRRGRGGRGRACE